MKNFTLLGLIGLLTIPFIGNAQSFFALRRDRNFLVSAGTGTAIYKGEMVNPGDFGTTRPNVALGAEYYLNSRISARAQLTYFQLKGDDRQADDDRWERNLHFRSGNIELSVMGAINLMPMGLRFYQRSAFNLHAFAGIGVLYFNPKTYDNVTDEWVALQPLQTEGKKYSRIQPVIPVGIGARIKLDPFFNILIEGGYRFTFTDYLDDVSIRRYPNPNILKSEQARRLSDRRPEIDTQPSRPQEVGVRGNPKEKDGYLILNVTLQYYLPKLLFQNYNKLYNVPRKGYYRKPRRS
jgi:hypothetical protein